MTRTKIKIGVVSDVVCPWCFIGKKRLEKAIDQLEGQFDFEIEYSPFELNPNMPLAGKPQKQYLSSKLGGEERYQQVTQHVTQLATIEGLKFDFSSQAVSPNTHDSHRLIWLAREEDKQAEVNDALMSAYFEQGINLSDKENLKSIAVMAGLDEKKVTELLASDLGDAEVSYAEQFNHQRGITGVPFFVVNDQFGISGAQSVEVLVKTLTQIGMESVN